MPFVLNDLGVENPATLGAVAAVPALASAIGAIGFGRLAHLSVRVLVPAEFATAAVGLLIVPMAHDPVVTTAGTIVHGFAPGMVLPTMLTWSVSRLSFDQRGRGAGLGNGVINIGGFATPFVMSALGTGAGGLQHALMLLAAVSGVISIAWAVVLRREIRPLNHSGE
ncbi:MFS transporter [Nocardia sp. CA-119907]|uniref:MFS transporter n=1 Tax=Nocardia sp. CA-119907 TaxID=3239973 RepID=UPI003D981047